MTNRKDRPPKERYEEEGGFVQSTVVLNHQTQGKIKFDVVHNLPEVPGLCLDDAVVNWSYRTTVFTAKSLCEYINAKNTGFICLTMEAYNKLIDENS